MAAYTFPPAVVLLEGTGELAIGATGVLRAAAGGATVPMFDLNDSAITSVTVGPKGAHAAFKADVSDGVLDFGSVLIPVISIEAQRAGLDAVETALAAEVTAGQALTSAQAAEASVQPATATSRGTIFLAGALGGTAENPEVPGVEERAPIAHTHGVADAPVGAVNVVKRGPNGWQRPTARTDVVIFFKKTAPTDPDPAVVVPPALGGMYAATQDALGDVVIDAVAVEGGEAPVAGAPSEPTQVTATRTADTTATVSWQPPATDNGSAITGYRVVPNVGTAVNTGAATRSANFTGLDPTLGYTFTVTATNAVGRSVGVAVSVAAVAGTSGNSRFPGDTNPLVNGTVVWGIDEFDKDPTVIHASEVSAPEATAGVPAGAIREFFNSSQGSTPIATAGGAAFTEINKHHREGRIPWVSISYGSWAVQDDGRNNAAWDFFIDWCETNASGPVWFSILHEPENQTESHPNVGGAGQPAAAGTEADWYNIQKAFRARMDVYANARGGVGVYKWKRLAFGPILTAYSYARGTLAYGIDAYVTANVAAGKTPATERIFDFMGADYYVGGQAGTIGSPAWGNNIVKTVAWCKKYGYPLGIAEWGVNRRDAEAALKMQEIWDRTFDGTNDIFAWLYYNSSVGSTVEAEQRWLLDNVSNGGLLTKWVALLKNAKSVHYWDLKIPGTSTNYTRRTT